MISLECVVSPFGILYVPHIANTFKINATISDVIYFCRL
jgi:hypothetical protein